MEEKTRSDLRPKIGIPGKVSIGLGVAVPVLGIVARGQLSEIGSVIGVLALVFMILFWIALLRLSIFILQFLFRLVKADGKVNRPGSGQQYVHGNADGDARKPQTDAADRLRELKKLLDEGIITESEFAVKKSELLREL